VQSIPNLRPLDGGSLRNAVGMETFAAILLTVNVRHKMRASLRLITI
jgi:predicted dinucleotide-binding enzyme